MIRNFPFTVKGSVRIQHRQTKKLPMWSRAGDPVLAIYFYCRRYEDKHKKSSIYDYACRYLKSWFPDLPNYANFNSRVNNLDSVVLSLLPILLERIDNEHLIKDIDSQIALVDSFPIILCSGKRAGKVARELSDKSFCSTKNLFYYGVKMHMVAQRVRGSIPLMEFVSITSASENDLTAIRPILPKLAGKAIFADKAYVDAGLNQKLVQEQDTYIYTPVKLKKVSHKLKGHLTKQVTICSQLPFQRSDSPWNHCSTG